MQHDRNKVLIFRGTAAVISIAAIVYTFLSVKTAMDVAIRLCFFTEQSNIFICVFLVILFIKTIIDRVKLGRYGEICSIKHRTVHFIAVIYITLTFFVFAIVLAVPVFINTIKEEGAVMSILNSLCLHYIVPVMAIIDWIKFAPHGNRSKEIPFIAISYFPIYFVTLIIRASSGVPMVHYGDYVSLYPYPFLDINLLGWWSLLVIPIVIVLLATLAYGYMKFDGYLYKRQQKQKAEFSEETVSDEQNQLQ